MKNTDYFTVAEKNLPGGGLGGYALPEDVRFIYSHGEGPYFWDADGRRYVDYVGGAGALILGHCPPSVVAAVREQAGRSLHMFGSLNEQAVRLSARLVEDIPCAEKIAYATTGSEATAYALRMARAFTGRDKVIKFEGGYHGNYDYVLSGTFPKVTGNYPQAVSDTGGQPQATLSTMLVCPYNDIEVLQSVFSQHGGDIAAVIVEGCQRIIRADGEFLAAIRSLTEEHGAVMILDEVVTGFRWSYQGAQGIYDITPDLACYGKVIGGGGSLSVVAGRAEIINLADPARKGQGDYAYMNGTLHGNALGSVMTEAVLDALSAEGFYDDLNSYSDNFCAEANEIVASMGIGVRFFNVGSLWQILGCEAAPRDQGDILSSDAGLARRLDHLLLGRGHYILPGVRRFFSGVHDGETKELFMADLHEVCKEI